MKRSGPVKGAASKKHCHQRIVDDTENQYPKTEHEPLSCIINDKLSAVQKALTSDLTGYNDFNSALSTNKQKHWILMSKRKIYTCQQEWEYARSLLSKLLKEKSPPFKISKKVHSLDHSFIVVNDAQGVAKLGVMALNHPTEGILGQGGFGICKLICWEDGSMSAVKIEPLVEYDLHQYENANMQKLGVLQANFTITRNPRALEQSLSLSSPNDERTKSYKIMTFINGVSLKTFLNSPTTFPQHHTLSAHLKVALTMIASLTHMHAHGIIHNDIHSENILVEEQCVAHFVDFGKSIDVTSIPKGVKQLLKLIGRQDINAPEIVEFSEQLLNLYSLNEDAILDDDDKIPFSPASDIYSLGLIFENLFQDILFSPTVENLISQMKHENPSERLSLKAVQQQLNSPQFLEAVQDADGLYDDLPYENPLYKVKF